jgi:hypothetical protein
VRLLVYLICFQMHTCQCKGWQPAVCSKGSKGLEWPAQHESGGGGPGVSLLEPGPDMQLTSLLLLCMYCIT